MSAAEQIDEEGLTAEEESQIFDTIDKWLERDVRPVVKKFDHADEYPYEIVEQMKEMGLFRRHHRAALRRPRHVGLNLRQGGHSDYRGLDGFDPVSSTRTSSWRRWFSGSVPRYKNSTSCRGLPRASCAAALGLTEPNAGTDLQAIRTRADKDGDNYVVNGGQDLDHQRDRGHLLRAAHQDRHAE